MAKILLCTQPTNFNTLEAKTGSSVDNITGLSCVNPEQLASYTPYLADNKLSTRDEYIMRQLSPMPIAKELTHLSLSLGEDNTLALAEISASLSQYNIGIVGTSTSVYANRMNNFVGAVKNYQGALMDYRHATKGNAGTKVLAKQKAVKAFQHMQSRFHNEINAVSAGIKAKKGTVLTSATRGTNIARSSRNTAKLDVMSRVQANNLVKLTQHAKVLGNGLAVIDFSSRIGKVHNSYKAGDHWERDLFIASSSFALSATAGTLAVKGGLALLVFATPFGWAGLIIGGVAVAGIAAGASLVGNHLTKERSGLWYDNAMEVISTL